MVEQMFYLFRQVYIFISCCMCMLIHNIILDILIHFNMVILSKHLRAHITMKKMA